MRYYLSRDVYIVSGIVNGCIYDFNRSKLYSVNSNLKNVLCQISRGQFQYNAMDFRLNDVLEKLKNRGILTDVPQQLNRSISSIVKSDGKINFAWIEVTNRCNLRCVHCYNESSSDYGRDMTIDDFKLVIECLVKKKIEKIQIIGGEPFVLGKLLKEMLDYVVDKFSYVEIFTNGTLVTDEWFDYLKKNGIRMALSVYSYDDSIHDRVTGQNGSWHKTNATIEKLNNYGIVYRVCNVLMKGVCVGKKNNKLYSLSNEKDVVRMSGRGNFKLLTKELIKKRLIAKHTFMHQLNKNFCEQAVKGHQCFDCKLYIASNLDVYPCVMERRLKHCNIKENKKIFFADEIRKLNKDKVDVCMECEYRYACYDCRPDSLSDDLYSKPWYCTYDPLSGKWENEDEFIDKLFAKWEIRN